MSEKLSDVVTIISGGTPKTSVKEFWDGNIDWLAVADFNSSNRYVSSASKKITELGLNNSNTKMLEKGDLIISARGTVGAIAQLTKPMAFNQSCFGLRGKKNKLDTDYLYYWLKNYVDVLLNKSQGSVFNTINLSTFDDIKIELPSIADQRKISNLLTLLDDKIEINNQINQELEAMAKTLYDYWFVQFDFPDQNGKPYKSSGGKMVYHPELKREIPEGWGVARLDQLQIATGKRDANFGTENGKYDFWTTANSPIKADEFSFEGKAILIAGNGNFYVNFTDGKFEAYQRTYVIQSEDEKMLIFMYMACLQSAEKLRKASNGSIIKYITIGDVNNISSPYDHNVVDEFVKIYRPLIDQISKNKKQNQELTQLRDWLLPMLMNGQVKVE
ncbi:restriction endonuclease subunit S [Streptococcus thermophilus]|uniref:restriction endonuclease subunit S n=1 Tax=Streptococcus thermophilus TaxID=1308 RepID=UPI0003EEE382|nr:restriction endonuclease subunit S [Streptococcus thermophilus]EWM59609.1 type I restriction endonuclease subunit S [Streptococcus thermophilus TH982]MDA5540202.1 restriction endonuclease subunit S [Streptococcus thermophilus]MDA5551079.1 restriction endonuclease subunit S [Streptococcus thermophilus]